jgi:hypothetical protein
VKWSAILLEVHFPPGFQVLDGRWGLQHNVVSHTLDFEEMPLFPFREISRGGIAMLQGKRLTGNWRRNCASTSSGRAGRPRLLSAALPAGAPETRTRTPEFEAMPKSPRMPRNYGNHVDDLSIGIHRHSFSKFSFRQSPVAETNHFRSGPNSFRTESEREILVGLSIFSLFAL